MSDRLEESLSAELYSRFICGDTSAFEELVSLYRQSLTLFIYRIVNDMDTAEDLAEDVFVKLLVKKPRYKGDASFKTWLFTAGRNLSVDYLRRHRRTTPVEEPPRGGAEQVEDKVLATETKRAVYRALDLLSKEEKLLMYLIYIEDLGYAHAEKVLHASRGELYSMARKAKEKLKAQLIKEGIEF